MAGVGETGYWRTGVWVEPLEAEGDFSLTATGVLDQWIGRFSYSGSFDLSGVAAIVFDGVNVFRGEFQRAATGDLDDWEGTFQGIPFAGIFALSGQADLFVAWVPELGHGGEVGIPESPAEVGCIIGPGDAFIFEGASGTVVKDSQGRLVVIDQSGEVMCIIGPSGVILG